MNVLGAALVVSRDFPYPILGQGSTFIFLIFIKMCQTKSVRIFSYMCLISIISCVNQIHVLTICMLGNFVCFLSSADFFSNLTFSNNFQEYNVPSKYETVWIHTRLVSGFKLFAKVISR